ncbi:uncharacterized protein A4U43_C05F28160 [Asparagus officinalis]|uniref:Uncharacterized protein n=1 Tax=Asparagus officinalis TaxID=4686 RepID=A0A5P1EVQ4_ASPOF|nr:uncharacterized protein A4U43_C05F28160 [Asparagus officinalis]
MGECTGEAYTVKITAEDRVSAVLPLQEHWLPLSNLDLLLPPLDVGVFFCYKNGDTLSRYLDDFDGMVSVLKASLAKALVAYYPLAGEVVANSAGEPEVLCNNRGVDFIVASADVDLERLNLYNADESVEKKLVPEKKGGVISVQEVILEGTHT